MLIGSQPFVGIMGNQCKEDDKLIKAIYNTNKNSNYLKIIDARFLKFMIIILFIY